MPCAALKVPGGVSRLSAAHQPSPAYEVTRFYLATHPRRAPLDTTVSRGPSTRSLCSRGVGRVSCRGHATHAQSAYHTCQQIVVVIEGHAGATEPNSSPQRTSVSRKVARFYLATHPRRALLDTNVSSRRSSAHKVRAAWVEFVSLPSDTCLRRRHTACTTRHRPLEQHRHNSPDSSTQFLWRR